MSVGIDRNGGSTVRAWARCDHAGCGATFCVTASEVRAVARVLYAAEGAGWTVGERLSVACPKHGRTA